MTLVKTKLKKWPRAPWPTIPRYVALTLAERVSMLEHQLRGSEPNQRDINWLTERDGRIAEQGDLPLPLCERRR